MIAELLPWLADALVIAGLVLMSISIYGMIWMPDLYTRLHAASKGIIIGNLLQLVAAMLVGEPATIMRAVLIGLFLLLTTPVSAHIIAQAAFQQREPLRTPGALDESGMLRENGEQEAR
jgi:multicomponent Na+:H+ antiporter subunit G